MRYILFLTCLYSFFIYSVNQNDRTEETGVVNFSNSATSGNQLSIAPSDLSHYHNSPALFSFLRCTELSTKSMYTVLQENVLLREKVEKLEGRLASVMKAEEKSSMEVSLTERKHVYHLRSSSVSQSSVPVIPKRSSILPVPTTKRLEPDYIVTSEEKNKLNDVYQALPEIEPRYISAVLKSKNNRPSSRTFRAIQEYIVSKGGNLIEYKNCTQEF